MHLLRVRRESPRRPDVRADYGREGRCALGPGPGAGRSRRVANVGPEAVQENNVSGLY